MMETNENGCHWFKYLQKIVLRCCDTGMMPGYQIVLTLNVTSKRFGLIVARRVTKGNTFIFKAHPLETTNLAEG